MMFRIKCASQLLAPRDVRLLLSDGYPEHVCELLPVTSPHERPLRTGPAKGRAARPERVSRTPIRVPRQRAPQRWMGPSRQVRRPPCLFGISSAGDRGRPAPPSAHSGLADIHTPSQPHDSPPSKGLPMCPRPGTPRRRVFEAVRYGSFTCPLAVVASGGQVTWRPTKKRVPGRRRRCLLARPLTTRRPLRSKTAADRPSSLRVGVIRLAAFVVRGERMRCSAVRYGAVWYSTIPSPLYRWARPVRPTC
ncbi:hypothetical protein GGR56DRAFT_331341 [Xylariaceae sp. FL0804]|nr:hypothetical protein GGR56DRAFT_331341 [Xylariaceae sp. FL0804]